MFKYVYISILIIVSTAYTTCSEIEIPHELTTKAVSHPHAATLFSSTQAMALNFPLVQGYLDKSNFGTNNTGTSFVSFSIAGAAVANDVCKTIAIQADGKIILAGWTKTTNGNTYFALARYLTNGKLDTTFGRTTGAQAGTTYITPTISNGTNDRINALVIQPDGKILVAGWTSNNGTNYFGIARFTTAGLLDTTFGGANGTQPGTTFINQTIGGGINDQATDMVLQSDGKIVISGFTNKGNNIYCALVRLTTTGQLDTTFGGTNAAQAGTAYIPFSIAGGTLDIATALKVQSDGSILISAYSEDVSTDNIYFAVARFTSAGALDTTFGRTTGTSAGTYYIPFAIGKGIINIPTCLATQSDGSIILGGFTTNGNNGPSYFALARFTTTGKLDTNFGQVGTAQAGTSSIPFSISSAGTVYDYAAAAIVQFDDTIILGGWSSNADNFITAATTSYAAVARFTPTGSLDINFGQIGTAQAGTQYIPFNVSNVTSKTIMDNIYALALQPNGSIVAGGWSSNGINGPSYFSVARFISFTTNLPSHILYGL